MTCTGKTLGSLLETYEARPDDVLKTLEAPQKPEGGIAVLRGNLAPRGAVVKQSGVRESMYRFTGKIWGGGDGTRVFFCRLRLRGCVTKQND